MTHDFALQHARVVVQVAEHQVKIDSLEKRQDGQDASLIRIEDKLDVVKTALLSGVACMGLLAVSAAGVLVMFILGKVKF
jgi:hypothetical protein